jgi:site-specific recombinase XerD
MEELMTERMERKLDETLKRYTGFLKNRQLSQEIISIHCAEIRHYFSWRAEGGNLPYGSGRLTSMDFKAYINQSKKVNPRIVGNRVLPALRSFLAFNQKINNYGANLSNLIPNHLENQKAKCWLDGEQQQQLERAIDRQLQTPLYKIAWSINWIRSAVLVRFLLHTGMHSVELRALRLGDIRLGDLTGVVHVHGSRERRMPLDGAACDALRHWLNIRPDGEEDWLWLEMCHNEARLISERAIWRACRRIVHLAGLEPGSISPRILRNTCAHNLLVSGESPRVVGRLLKFPTSRDLLRFL